MTNYPNGMDAFVNPTASDDMDSAVVPHHKQHADANDAITAIETELGTNPSGSYPTVVSRLDALAGATSSISAQGAITAATNGSTVSIGAPAQTVQTQNLHNVALSGNTSGTMATISSGIMTIAGGNNITLSQVGNAFTVSGPTTVAQSIQTQNMVTVNGSTGAVSISGGANVTVGNNAGTITISAAAAGGAGHADVIAGNTAGATASVSSGTLQWAGGNNITLSQNANSITISGANVGGAQTGISGIAGSNTTYTSGTVQFIGTGGGITVSSNTGQRIDLSVAAPVAQTVQTQNIHNLTLSGNTAGVMAQVSSGTLSLAGGNNVTLSQNGNAVTISAANTVAQTVQTQNLYNLTLSGNTAGVMAQVSSGTLSLAGGNNVTLSQNGNAVTISAANTVAQTVQTQNLHNVTLSGNTAGAMAQISSGTLNLAGGNNITLSQNANSVTISGPNTVAQSVQTQGMVTLNGSTGVLSISGGNNITVGNNASTITISAPNQTIQTQLIQALVPLGNTSGTTASLQSNSIGLSAGNNITISQSSGANSTNLVIIGGAGAAAGSGTFGISNLGNTAGTSGTIAGSNNQFVLAGGNNVTLSQSINGSSATVTISAGAGGVSPVMSMYPEFPMSTQMSGTLYSGSVGAGGNSTATTVSAWVQPMAVDDPFVWNEMRIPVQWSATTTVTSVNWSYTQGLTAGIYTQNGTQLNLVESYSNRLYVSHASTNTSGSASITASMSYGGSDTNGSSNVGLSTNTGTAAGFWTRMTNTKNYLFRGGTSTTSMSAGQYYLVVAGSYSTAGSALNVLSQVGHYATANVAGGGMRDWGLATASTTNALPLHGLASLVMASNTIWPVTIATNAITQASNNVSFVNRMVAASFIARTS